MLCELTGKKLVVNVDGLESRRKKFSLAKRRFLYLSDRLAQRFAHIVVIDNEALRTYLVPKVRANAVLIAYPGDHVLRSSRGHNTQIFGGQYLSICRIEPENQCHLLLESFARARSGTYVFVGNWSASDYGRKLRKQYSHVPGLEMRDPIYDKNVLANLRDSCSCYLHGHSVGGTNPSLVEMLFYDCKILAFDCVFNRKTAGDSIYYFSDSDDLISHLTSTEKAYQIDRGTVRHQYTRAKICADYINLIERLTKAS